MKLFSFCQDFYKSIRRCADVVTTDELCAARIIESNYITLQILFEVICIKNILGRTVETIMDSYWRSAFVVGEYHQLIIPLLADNSVSVQNVGVLNTFNSF